jgi:hypothetical protein
VEQPIVKRMTPRQTAGTVVKHSYVILVMLHVGYVGLHSANNDAANSGSYRKGIHDRNIQYYDGFAVNN